MIIVVGRTGDFRKSDGGHYGETQRYFRLIPAVGRYEALVSEG